MCTCCGRWSCQYKKWQRAKALIADLPVVWVDGPEAIRWQYELNARNKEAAARHLRRIRQSHPEVDGVETSAWIHNNGAKFTVISNVCLDTFDRRGEKVSAQAALELMVDLILNHCTLCVSNPHWKVRDQVSEKEWNILMIGGPTATRRVLEEVGCVVTKVRMGDHGKPVMEFVIPDAAIDDELGHYQTIKAAEERFNGSMDAYSYAND